MENFRLFPVLCATVSAFLLSGVWYSPMMFLKIWEKESKLGKDIPKKGHGPLVFGIAILLAFIAAIGFSISLGSDASFENSIKNSLVIGGVWVFTSFGINYSFGGKSLKLLLIDGGYHINQFVLYGLIFGLWPR